MGKVCGGTTSGPGSNGAWSGHDERYKPAFNIRLDLHQEASEVSEHRGVGMLRGMVACFGRGRKAKLLTIELGHAVRLVHTSSSPRGRGGGN